MSKKNKKDKRKSAVEFVQIEHSKISLVDNTLTYQGDISLTELANTLKKVKNPRQKPKIVREDVKLTKTQTKTRSRHKKRRGRQYTSRNTNEVSTWEWREFVDVKDYEIIKHFFMKGQKLLVNSVLSFEQVKEFCEIYKINVVQLVPLTDEEIAKQFLTSNKGLEEISRNPVISIMGHVDHGKTTLLDTIRKSNVVSKEKGGITQHIGAYVIDHKGKLFTFIDTPGHEAFIQMRRRGARATDISIIVVAADDGVKPQTIEAIKHAKEANVEIIVAINKIDKPDKDIDNLLFELTQQDIIPEKFGGDVPCVEISAKENINIDALLDTIEVTSEVLDLKTTPNKYPSGIVIESHLDSHLGAVASLLVQNGTLRLSDPLVIGHIAGKARQIIDENGKSLKEALPGTPVRISGLSDTPHVGDLFVGFKNEKEGKKFSAFKKELYLSRKKGDFNKVITQRGNKKIINLIIRSDTQGSLEAIKGILVKFNLKSQHINIVSMHVGKVTQTDLDLALSTKASVIAFNVGTVSRDLDSYMKNNNVHFIKENIIYKIEDAIKEVIVNDADSIITIELIGKGEIKKIFIASKVGDIAGCVLTQGKATKDSTCHLTRKNKKVVEAEIDSLKRFQNEVNEVTSGQEFGIVLEGGIKYEENDVLEFFKTIITKPTIEDLIDKRTSSKE